MEGLLELGQIPLEVHLQVDSVHFEHVHPVQLCNHKCLMIKF